MVLMNLLFFWALCFLYKSNVGRSEPSSTALFWGLLGIVLFSVFSFWGVDWFNYYDLFKYVKTTPYASSHLEPFYVWAIDNLCSNYLIFRVFIWGLAVVLLLRMLIVLQLDQASFFFFFVPGFLIWFSYSRVSLAMSLLFYGCALVLKERKSLFSFAVGFVALFLSIYLHKSAVIGVAIVLIALFLNRINSKTYVLFFIFVPLILVALRYILGNMVDFSFNDDYMEFVTEAGSRNLDSEVTKKGLGSFIQSLLEKTPYYLSAICCIMMQRSKMKLPKSILCFSNITIMIVLTSTLLLFLDEFNTSTLSTRLFRFCIIPAPVILSYCWKNRLNKRIVAATLWVGFFSSTYQLLYALYVIK